ncbi:hypothetical protein H9X57_04250 [Flavobacterium piscinae]|uniref:hypothetical protein n=1 Tax=Flavobacterium piscinae TaxID=2506424 RepID=UPI00199F005C|nr:hypothetical protein [Flavobacterium piscinae]MBC8882869.1 hypothetical protein [Flavobacterium piscinae]
MYTYTLIGTPPCANSTASVTVTVNPTPNPGEAGVAPFCANSPADDLFNYLGGTPDAGGTWSPALASGTGVFDPAQDTAGVYTYTVSVLCETQHLVPHKAPQLQSQLTPSPMREQITVLFYPQ